MTGSKCHQCKTKTIILVECICEKKFCLSCCQYEIHNCPKLEVAIAEEKSKLDKDLKREAEEASDVKIEKI